MHFQSHEALREGHRLQNREILREQIEPLAYMLNEDSRNGESEFEVVSTLRYILRFATAKDALTVYFVVGGVFGFLLPGFVVGGGASCERCSCSFFSQSNHNVPNIA